MRNILAGLRHQNYWAIAFSLWFFGFLLLPQGRSVNGLTYLLLIVPVLISMRWEEFKTFLGDGLVRGFIILCMLLAVLAVDAHEAVRVAKYGLILLLFYYAVARLPPLTTLAVWRSAWMALIAMSLYVGYAACVYSLNGQWHFGDRLPPLLGKMYGQIYVTDVMAVILAVLTYAGMVLKRYRGLLLGHALTLFLALAVLQTRSVLPIWGVIVLLSMMMPGQLAASGWRGRVLVALLAGGIVASGLLFSEIGHQVLARSDSYRLEIWSGYIAATLECGLWFGCGVGHEINFVARDGLAIAHSHNIFVAHFMMSGLIGLGALLAYFGTALWYGLRQHYYAGWWLAAGLAAMMFDGYAIITSPNERWLLLHLPLALIVGHRIRAAADSQRR